MTTALIIMYVVIGFILGVISTFVFLLSYAYKKMPLSTAAKIKKHKASTSPTPNSGKSLSTDSELLDKLRAITDEQLAIKSQLDLPQKNALHGKHKNALVKRMQSLEDDKISLLKQILASGYDPKITTLDEYGRTETIKLSEYLASMDVDMTDSVKKEEQVKPNLRLVKEETSEEKADDNDSNR